MFVGYPQLEYIHWRAIKQDMKRHTANELHEDIQANGTRSEIRSFLDVTLRTSHPRLPMERTTIFSADFSTADMSDCSM